MRAPLHPVVNERVTVIGGARSGSGAARLLRRRGADVFVTDQTAVADEFKRGLEAEGIPYEEGAHSERSRAADWAVVSPGVPSTAEIVRYFDKRSIPVYSEIEVASWFCDAPIVAITGSNGKTTTSMLLAHVYRSAGRPVTLAGNIGQAFSDSVDSVPDDGIVVLEVSSFQLDRIASFRPHVSVLLNITPDHLDRYNNSFEEYAQTKFRIFENQREDDVLIFNDDDETIRRGVVRHRPFARVCRISLEKEVDCGAFVSSGTICIKQHDEEERLMHIEELTLKGRHNLYNSLAAAMAARVTEIGSGAVRDSLSTFEGVPHRLELVRIVDGVQYVNDSKATNVNSLWYALESLDEPVLLIMGGRDKGNDYDVVRSLVRQKVKALVAIGESSGKILDKLGTEVPLAVEVSSLDDAVHYAQRASEQGDVILLSPACASFDMFNDFEDRGDSFRRIVAGL